MNSSKLPYLQSFQEALLNSYTQITIDEFNKLQNDYNFILKLIWMNEKYNIILDNYYDFELEVLKAEKELLNIQNIQELTTLGQKYIVNFNRKLFNILSSVRMYIDQTRHDLSSINIPECNKDTFHKYTAQEYDSRVGYQIMELLRNYMQHQGLLIDSLEIITPLFSSNDDLVNIIVELDYKKLKSIDRYKNKIKLDDILQSINSEKFNIIWFLQDYVNGIIQIQKQLNTTLNPIIDKSISEIETILQKYYKTIPDAVGVFNKESEFLLQHNYVKNIKNQYKIFKSNFKKRKVIKTSKYLKNCKRDKIKYNMK